MHRSGSLLAVVITQLFGSLLVLGIGTMVLMGALSATPMDLAAHHESRSALLSVAGALGAVMVWGVATALGLLWKRAGALVSTLIFSFLMLATGLGSLTIAAASPAPTVDLGLGLVLVGLAAWWIAYFTRASIRQEFSVVRPVSLAVIGWTLLAGGVLAVACVPLLGAGASVAVGAHDLHGRAAAFAWFGAGAVSMVVGLGLLELRRWARTAALAWLIVLLLNAAAAWLVVAGKAAGVNPLTLATGVSLGMVAFLVQIYFLWTRKAAFTPQALATEATGATPPKRRWRRA